MKVRVKVRVEVRIKVRLGFVLGLGSGLGVGVGVAEERSLRGWQCEARAPRQCVHDEVKPLEGREHGEVVDGLEAGAVLARELLRPRLARFKGVGLG